MCMASYTNHKQPLHLKTDFLKILLDVSKKKLLHSILFFTLYIVIFNFQRHVMLELCFYDKPYEMFL